MASVFTPIGSGLRTQDDPYYKLAKTASADYGSPIAIVYGTRRIKGTVLLSGQYMNSYVGRALDSGLYQVGLCEGPISEVLAVWREKTKYTTGALGMTILDGAGIDAWSAATTYAKGTWASNGGTNYVSIQAGNLNHAPPNVTWWAARGATATERAQSPWSYLATTKPEWALGYGGTALGCVSTGWVTNTLSELGRATFEVSGLFTSVTGAAQTIYPTSIIIDLLTNAEYGLSWPTSRIEGYSLSGSQPFGFTTGIDGTANTSLHNFLAMPTAPSIAVAIEDQRPARDILEEIATSTNALFLWSEGLLKMRPLADDYYVGGVTYDGPLALKPVYDLGASEPGADFLANPGEDPIEVERAALKDHFNCYPVEWSNRAPARVDANGTSLAEPFNAYNADVEDGTPDPLDVSLYGIRKAAVTSLRCIVRQDHAAYIANQLARRSIYSRNTYRFRLGWRFGLLEPCDLVTITDATLGLSRRLVRILEIEEDELGAFDIKAEEVGTVPVALSATYTLT